MIKFVTSGRKIEGWISRPIETYYNPATCELFERRMIGGQWTKFESNSPVDSRALDSCRDEIVHNQRLEDSCEVRGVLSQIMCGVMKDILPIIEYYLVACYPEKLIPATVENLKGWLPDCDFTNVCDPGNGASCGWYTWQNVQLSVMRHSGEGVLGHARGFYVLPRITRRLITICLELIIPQKYETLFFARVG